MKKILEVFYKYWIQPWHPKEYRLKHPKD